MKTIFTLILIWLFTYAILYSQGTPENQPWNQNIAGTMIQSGQRLTLGGYAQIDYNQPVDRSERRSGEMDIHRFVMLLGYKFSDKVTFITEIEYEHVTEVYIEQAFLDYKIAKNHSVRGGLMLIPVGIINEYHEPPTYNGVERPLIDTHIIPTTWREIGAGITGVFPDIALKYQTYLVTGFNGYDGTARLNGTNGLRRARQKGASSLTNRPDLTGRIEYYGLPGLNLGLSGYVGKTESVLYDGVNTDNKEAIARADSSTVQIGIAALDARYRKKGFQAKIQLYRVFLGNTNEYNNFTAGPDGANNLGSGMYGYYLEAGYNILRGFEKLQTELIPFLRYEQYDMHYKTQGSVVRNPLLRVSAITTGLTYMAAPGAAIKADYQFINRGKGSRKNSLINIGIGVMF